MPTQLNWSRIFNIVFDHHSLPISLMEALAVAYSENDRLEAIDIILNLCRVNPTGECLKILSVTKAFIPPPQLPPSLVVHRMTTAEQLVTPRIQVKNPLNFTAIMTLMLESWEAAIKRDVFFPLFSFRQEND